MNKWKLGWRLVNSSLDQNYKLGELQFDSLLNMKGAIEAKFILTGLEILAELGKKEKIVSVLRKQDQGTLEEICNKELFVKRLTDIEICESVASDEKIANRSLQLELIKMYINDQSVRGNVLSEMMKKYGLDEKDLRPQNSMTVDGANRERLKEIINEFGFPTRQLVGKEAMHGVFLIIQHSDIDKEWQKEQLPNIEKAVRQGDMDGQSYGYLYDRIKVNGGEKQLYGTQLKSVDPITKTVELADTEDLQNLDKRRMEVGIMPIEMYKQFVLRNVSN
jgi:hypothetical protein